MKRRDFFKRGGAAVLMGMPFTAAAVLATPPTDEAESSDGGDWLTADEISEEDSYNCRVVDWTGERVRHVLAVNLTTGAYRVALRGEGGYGYVGADGRQAFRELAGPVRLIDERTGAPFRRRA